MSTRRVFNSLDGLITPVGWSDRVDRLQLRALRDGHGPLGYPGSWLAAISETTTVAQALRQFPHGYEVGLQAERSLRFAIEAARRQGARDEEREAEAERREIFNLEPAPDDELLRHRRDDAKDLLQRAVLVSARYVESPQIDVLRRAAAYLSHDGSGRDTNLGDLVMPDGSVLACHDLSSRYDSLPLWVLGFTCSYRDEEGWNDSIRVMEVFRPLGMSKRPIVLWQGLSRAASIERTRWMEMAIGDIAEAAPDPVARRLSTLALAVHAPKSENELDFGLRESVRDELTALIDGATPTDVLDAIGVDTLSLPLPAPRLIKGADAAEEYAAEWLRAIGFADARRTPKGADGGADVVGTGMVAQVKFEGIPTGRPAIQALFGIATLDRSQAVFFSLMGYTAHALEWATRAGVACFQFEADGSVQAVSPLATALASGGAITSAAPAPY